MGGAGFPTGAKWEIVADQAAEPKYVICNADESEPGTFKDRQILAEQPHLVIEGMLAGMIVVGAEQGWVFIRHEYGLEEAEVRAELDAARAAGLLGNDVLGSGRTLNIEVFTSPGGYILGEESALIECMEGHRGEPRNKPPFPGTNGLWGKPTLMNSVETFAAVPIILQRGAEWWKDQGVNGGVGLKFFAISGDIANPDVYCVPMGTTARELIELAGGLPEGVELGGFQPGGASSNFLGPDRLDVPLDFKPLADAGSMLGSGAVVVMGDRTNLLAAATNVLRFFRNESCGKCVPCRIGSHKAHRILTDALERGAGADGIDDRIDRLDETLAADLDLRARAGGARAGDERAAAAAHAHLLRLNRFMATTGRDFFTVKTVSEALMGFRPGHVTRIETVALDDACGRVPAADVRAPGALPGFDRSSVDGYAVRARGHVRRVRVDPRIPANGRCGPDGGRRFGGGRSGDRGRDPDGRDAASRRRRGRDDRAHRRGDLGHGRGRSPGRPRRERRPVRRGRRTRSRDRAPGASASGAGRGAARGGRRDRG